MNTFTRDEVVSLLSDCEENVMQMFINIYSDKDVYLKEDVLFFVGTNLGLSLAGGK